MKIIDEMLKVAGEQRKEAQETLENPDVKLSSDKKKFVEDALREIDQLTEALKDVQQMFEAINTNITWQKLNCGKGINVWVLKLQDAQFCVALEKLQKNYRAVIKENVRYRAEKKLIEKLFRQKSEAENYVRQYMEDVLAEHKDIIDREEFFVGFNKLVK